MGYTQNQGSQDWHFQTIKWNHRRHIKPSLSARDSRRRKAQCHIQDYLDVESSGPCTTGPNMLQQPGPPTCISVNEKTGQPTVKQSSECTWGICNNSITDHRATQTKDKAQEKLPTSLENLGSHKERDPGIRSASSTNRYRERGLTPSNQERTN